MRNFLSEKMAKFVVKRRDCVPIVYTKGTHYDVGFDVGRTFASVIQNFLNLSEYLNEELLPAYETLAGKSTYESTLNCVKSNFPQYVRELEGTADGAGVPFYKLFLLHMDRIATTTTSSAEKTKISPVGCSTICVNQPEAEILGHTEDALRATLNHFYIVSAHVIPEKPEGKWRTTEEKFTSLCYAGHLPGYTMSYNHHGLIFSINTLTAQTVLPGKTPRHFLTRALLAAENFAQAQQILRDAGTGAGDGCSINMCFLNQEGDRLFHNVEMGPAYKEDMSQLNVLTISPGENAYHCNSYQRLSMVEDKGMMWSSSVARLSKFREYPKPMTKRDVAAMLGDQTNKEFPVFQESVADETVKTIAAGLFDCKEKTWSIYSDNPSKTEPLVVLPLILKKA